MTKFQDRCMTQVKALLSSVTDIPMVSFEEKHVVASTFMPEVLNLLRQTLGLAEVSYREKELAETSFVTKFRFKDHNFTIYIYENDAELHRDDEGFLCEQPDYVSEDELLRAFAGQISKAISNEHFDGNCKTSGREWSVISAALVFVLAAIIGSGFWLFHLFSRQAGGPR